MADTIQKDQDGTIILTITIPWENVKKTWDAVIDSAMPTVQIEGFRKGKAPKKLVEEKLDKENVREEVLKKLLPQAYGDAIKKYAIRPVINPKIHVEKVEEGKDWQFNAITCEIPDITLGDYKKNIQKITAKSKIIIPGKEQNQPKFDDIVKALLDSITITIPKILITQETERLLAQILDEIKRLGLTLDQYLASTNRTPEALRQEYEQKATTDMTLEFALGKIAETEKITVEEKEINEAIQKAKNPAERQNLENNRYLLASILRQQKTLDFLRDL